MDCGELAPPLNWLTDLQVAATHLLALDQGGSLKATAARSTWRCGGGWSLGSGSSRHALSMNVKRVVPDFQAEDPGRSTQFYAEVLGLVPVMDLGWIVTFAAPENPAAQISVMRADATASVTPDASIEVDDVDAAFAAAQRLGCEIVHPLTNEPWGVRRFFVRDPSGRILNVLAHP